MSASVKLLVEALATVPRLRISQAATGNIIKILQHLSVHGNVKVSLLEQAYGMRRFDVYPILGFPLFMWKGNSEVLRTKEYALLPDFRWVLNDIPASALAIKWTGLDSYGRSLSAGHAAKHVGQETIQKYIDLSIEDILMGVYNKSPQATFDMIAEEPVAEIKEPAAPIAKPTSPQGLDKAIDVAVRHIAHFGRYNHPLGIVQLQLETVVEHACIAFEKGHFSDRSGLEKFLLAAINTVMESNRVETMNHASQESPA